MKRSTAWFISILMSIALMGLLSFQIYWINNAIALGEKQFEHDVQESLDLVVNKLERTEILNSVDKNLNIFLPEGGGVIELKAFKGDKEESFDIQATFEQIEEEEAGEGVIRKKIWTKSKMITEVFDDIMEQESRIDRLNITLLDSMLHTEFRDRGIHIQYEFGVFDHKQDTFIYSNSENPEDLATAHHRANLFPNDIIGNANYLMVNFPGQNSFLLEQISTTLATSVVFILIIVFTYIYTIRTIFRQKKISEIKNDFINNMTHEFKTPIATVSLATEALKEEPIRSDKSAYDRYLGIIRDETNRLGVQVEKVLQAAAMDKKEYKLKKEDVNVHELISTVIKNITLQVENREGRISTDLGSSDLVIQADPVHLSNVIYNLLDNAIKYSHEKPEITVATSLSANYLSISITDKGIGMRKEEVKKIFEKFYRVSTGNRHDVKGFGLGLSYVKAIVDAHGGDISIQSQPAKGSSFTIKLPMK